MNLARPPVFGSKFLGRLGGGFGLWESGSGFGLYGWWLGLEAWGVLLFMNYWCPAPWLVLTRCGLSFDCSAWEFSCIGIGRRGHGCFCVGTVSGQLFVISSANRARPVPNFQGLQANALDEASTRLPYPALARSPREVFRIDQW